MAIDRKERKRKRKETYNDLPETRRRIPVINYIEIVNLFDRIPAKKRRISSTSRMSQIRNDIHFVDTEENPSQPSSGRHSLRANSKRLVGYDRQSLSEVLRAVVAARIYLMEERSMTEQEVFRRRVMSLL
tara:strand:+ start:412 stop:801 length:390 start_codon:yes stop_codon:yes gene_type:complete